MHTDQTDRVGAVSEQGSWTGDQDRVTINNINIGIGIVIALMRILVILVAMLAAMPAINRPAL